MKDALTSKEALFMLETSMEEDMADYADDATGLAIKYINSTPELYKFIKGNLEFGLSIKDSANTWANNHNNEFGELFQTELEMVNWEKVRQRI